MAEKLGKPLLLTAFGKQRHGLASYMNARNALFDMVYQETQDAPTVAGIPHAAFGRDVSQGHVFPSAETESAVCSRRIRLPSTTILLRLNACHSCSHSNCMKSRSRIMVESSICSRSSLDEPYRFASLPTKRRCGVCRHAVLAADEQLVPGLRRVHSVHQPRGGERAAAHLAVAHAGAV